MIDLLSRDGSNSCPYCTSLFSKGAQTARWNRLIDRECDDVALVPTRGMLVEGWILAIPREHILSSSALSARRRSELWHRADRAVALVASSYGPATVFEHGAVVPGSVVGCGVDHAHIHVVPLSFDLAELARSHPLGRDLTWTPINDIRSVQDSQTVLSPYLVIQGPSGLGWRAAGSIPSQFFRRVIADAIGCPSQFDWRADAGMENIDATLAHLQRENNPTFEPSLASDYDDRLARI